MCYDDSARPPSPPRANEPAYSESIVLTAADGNRFTAYAAHPTQPARTQVAIFGDAGGLRPFYQELALRFAEIGIEAIAIDYYGRTAGLTAREASFEFRPHLNQLSLQGLYTDIAAALAYLRTGTGSERATFTLGFCMGGALSFLTSTTAARLAGAIGFYAYTGKMDGKSFLESEDQTRCPVLGLFGEADQVIPVSDVQAFDEKLDTAGVAHEIILYPDAPHGFFEAQQITYAEASADAWKRVLDFITRYTPSPG